MIQGTVASATVEDIKETSKRTFQIGVGNLSLSLGILLLNVFLKNYITVALTAGLSVSLIILLYLNYLKVPYIKTASVLVINVFITMICYAEGQRSGAYLYFFPMIAGLPLIFENTNRNNPELKIYILFTALCFALSIFFSRQVSTWQSITSQTYQIMLYINIACSFLLCIVFSYLNVYFERKFANALIEEKNRTQEAMTARTRFLSNMGHELRTPLNGIIGTANLLKKGNILPEQEHDLEILKYCSDHMLELVNDILDFNKIEAGKLELHPEKFTLSKLLKKTLLAFYNRFEEKGLELKSEIDPRLELVVNADDLRLTQIINNLLSNALKFTQHGSVTLKAECIDKHAQEVELRISVADTGIGIQDEDQQKVFESFWQGYNESTRRYSGTGLGLSICHRLLGLMNSELQLHSLPGSGTTFSFKLTLPVVSKKIVKSIKPERADLSGFRMLIAEDNQINMAIIKKTLLDWKTEITACWNGREAIEALQKDSNYNVILLDLEMPVMDGWEAVKEIKLHFPDIPVMAFTAALVDTEMYQKLLAIGFADCILKPFRPQELFSKIVQQVSVKAVN